MNLVSLRVIVVAVDLSPSSEEAIRTAMLVAGTHSGCRLHLVHVLSGALNMAFTEDRAAEWAARLSDTARPGVDYQFHTLQAEVPGAEIVRFAAKYNADLIVLGTAGRHGLSRLVLGSVAETVVRSAGCAVLVARAKAHEAVADE